MSGPDPTGQCGRGLETAAGGPGAQPRGTGRQHAAGHGAAAERGCGGNGGPGAELRCTGDQPGGERGDENGEAEYGDGRQNGRGRLRQGDLAGWPDQAAKQRGADADNDGQHHQLQSGGDNVAEHAFGEEGGVAKQGEGHQHEAREHRQFELDDGDKELHRQDEEGDQHNQPGQHQDGDGDEVGKEGGDADQLAGGL